MMKNKHKITIIASASLIALAGCSPVSNTLNKGISALDVESGHQVDEGNFGNPTLNNLLTQSAYGGQNGLILDLSRKFAKDVPSMITFAFNSAALDADAKEILRRQASWIMQFPDIRFRVYGHTDLVGSAEYNRRLGLRRAQNSVNFLVSRGISADRLEAVSSFGETQPLVVTEGRERRNRRTVTEVIGFTRNYVGDDLDGKYAALIYQQYVTGGVGLTGASTTSE